MKTRVLSFSEMTEKERKNEFNLHCAKGITSDIKDYMSDDRRKSAREWNERLHLVSHQGDGFVCVDNLKRQRGIEDLYGEGSSPKRKDAYEIYCDARELGLRDFTISYLTSYYMYLSLEDKFAGHYPEHMGMGESYDLFTYKTI